MRRKGSGADSLRSASNTIMRTRLRLLAPALLLASVAQATNEVASTDTIQLVAFTNTIANLEYSVAELNSGTRLGIHPPDFEGEIWYGQMTRRIPGSPLDWKNDFSFAVSYEGAKPRRAVCDLNRNDDFCDDPELTAYSYQANPGAVAFLVTLQWTANHGGASYPIDWLLRIVAEPKRDLASAPIHRLQHVRAPVGTFVVDGIERRAVLYDGNADGLYTTDLGDGVLVDANGDGHFDVDPMCEEFGTLSAAFQLGSEIFEVHSVEPTGKELRVQLLASGKERVQAARTGSPAPDFFLKDIDGRSVWLSKFRGKPVILDFFASWCSACATHAPLLVDLYGRYHARGLEVVGVSFDDKLADTEGFREKFGIAWPVEFSGRGFFENRLARLYRAKDAGTVLFINPDGIFEGEYDLVRLKERLAQIYPEQASVNIR